MLAHKLLTAIDHFVCAAELLAGKRAPYLAAANCQQQQQQQHLQQQYDCRV